MLQITQKQYDSLVDGIYSSLMSVKSYTLEGEELEMGMGEMGEARDEAERIVNEWMEENKITIPE